MQWPVASVACNKDTLFRVRPSCVLFLFLVVWWSTNKLTWAAVGLVFHHQWLIFKSCN